tara:strand:- start:728 stop:913 length:186 start_codon:yes stop_codon:yes gene_type:complete
MKMNSKQWEFSQHLEYKFDDFKDIKKYTGHTIGEMFLKINPAKFKALQKKWEQANAKEGWE